MLMRVMRVMRVMLDKACWNVIISPSVKNMEKLGIGIQPDFEARRGLFIQQDAMPSGGGSSEIQVERRPVPTTIEEAWRNYVDVIILVSNIPDESFFFPLDQDMLEEAGLTSLQMNDGRETLNVMHGINILGEEDKTKWPKTFADMFRKYIGYTPAQADLEAHPSHELFIRAA